MIGTMTLLTLAMRWMPPKMTVSDRTARMMPTHTGLKPKATFSALQMVLLWMELYDRPKVTEIRIANRAASHGWRRPFRM